MVQLFVYSCLYFPVGSHRCGQNHGDREVFRTISTELCICVSWEEKTF